METFFKVARVPHTNFAYAIFRIPTNGNDVFMCVSRSWAKNDERFVVEVDSQRFLSFWRNTSDHSHRKIARGNIAAWVQDEKFNDAKAGFSKGEIDPVPLADVSVFLFGDKTVSINITNGVTRTIYLLSIKASKFPVECDGVEQAKLIQQFAGLENGSFKSVKELISARTCT